jgi:outer membrane protein assembly factor BamB
MRIGSGMSGRVGRCVVGLLLAVAFGAWLGPAFGATPSIPDFTFLQVSDIHIDPRPAGVKRSETGRSVETIRWVCDEAGKTQALGPYGVTAPVPAFVIATGDLTEYGVIAETWSDFETWFAPLKCPLYVVPGNHDNTWTAILQIMRKRHGGDNYSFDQFGCHFVGLDTASPQEPVPCLDRRTLNWLRADLAKVDAETPVFLFYHHPLTSSEFVEPFEQLRLLEPIGGHDVVLMLDGHGHGVNHGQWEHVDRVMGGSTFGKNEGYNIISVVDGVLRVAYRYRDEREMTGLLEKKIGRVRPWCSVALEQPAADEAVGARRGVPFVVRVSVSEGALKSVTLDVAGARGDEVAMAARGEGAYAGKVSLAKVPPGRHAGLVTVVDDKDRTYRYGVAFTVAGDAWEAARRAFPAGFKAGPLMTDECVIVGDTAGVVRALDRSLAEDWAFETGGEVLGTPVLAGERLVFGSGDGRLYAVEAASGRKVWTYAARGPVYASPVVRDGIVYVGDDEGYVHAVRLADGQRVWSVKAAAFSIESAAALAGDVVVVGAWDGFVYGLDASSGTVRWKELCPTGHAGQKSRYYGPADCPAVVVGDRVFVTDRGYRLGLYGADGAFVKQIAEKVSGIAASENGQFVYARTLEDRLIKLDAGGQVVWDAAVAAGRFPIPPTERAGRVYVCSNEGLLTVVDAASGEALGQYRVTPQLPVMGAVGVGADGTAYVADMDGVVTRARCVRTVAER